MNDATSCPSNEWQKYSDKAFEIITLLNGMTYQDAKHVLDIVNSRLWNYAVIKAEEVKK